MLTKRQLEDAAECAIIDCADCSIQCINTIEATRRSAQTALAYRDMLEEVIKHLSHCPFCKINRPWLYKHKDGCKLAALLKESEVEEG
jgi:hypothetical protein